MPLGLRSINKRGKLVSERLAWVRAFAAEQPQLEPQRFGTVLETGVTVLAEIRMGVHRDIDAHDLDPDRSGAWLKAARGFEVRASQVGFPRINAWLQSGSAISAVRAEARGRPIEPSAPADRRDEAPPVALSSTPERPADWTVEDRHASDEDRAAARGDEVPRSDTTTEARNVNDDAQFEAPQHELDYRQVADWLENSFGRVNINRLEGTSAFAVAAYDNSILVIVAWGDESMIDVSDNIWFEHEAIDIEAPGTRERIAKAALYRNQGLRFARWAMDDESLSVSTSMFMKSCTQSELEFLIEVVASEMDAFSADLAEMFGIR